MLAAWYDEKGPAGDMLHVGELPDPRPGPGEVRVDEGAEQGVGVLHGQGPALTIKRCSLAA